MILQLLFAFLGFLASPKGFFAFGLGLIMFIGMPIVPRATGEFRSFANFHLWLATSMLQRAAIVVSEHGDLLLKDMEFDDLGVETMSFGSETKEFEDPDSALHYWMNIPFALADEAHGVLFDPRHAALGQRKNDAKERGEHSVRATQHEWDEYGIHEWKRGLYELPQKYELVNLGAVRHLVDGGERSEYPKRVEKLYQHSRLPFQSNASTARLIMIILALIGPFAAMWVLATQGGTGGGGGGSTVSYGTLLFAAGLPTLKEIDVKRAVTVLAVALPLPLLFGVLFVFVNPLFAVLLFVIMGMGFWFLPLVALLLKVTSFGGALSRMFMKLGLLGYEKPVLEWTPEKYQLREYSELDATGDVTWYGLCGSLIGFTFTPDEESWGAEVVNKRNVQNKQEVVADGGSPANSHIPAGYTRLPSMERGDVYAAFVPTDLDDDAIYLDTGIALSRFSDSANGEKALSRLLWAKEEYGGDNGLSDKSIAYVMAGCGIVSAMLGVFVFFL